MVEYIAFTPKPQVRCLKSSQHHEYSTHLIVICDTIPPQTPTEPFEKYSIDFILNGNRDDQTEHQQSDFSKPKQKARVRYLADEVASFGTSSSKEPKLERILDRIRKCLDRGHHPTTPEAEAKTSLAMAANLMAQHNLTEAEASSQSSERASRSCGDSSVTITHVENKEIGLHGFVGQLGKAMNEFFGCKFYYKTQPGFLDIVFYGLVNNTSAAAIAFEMCYNLIVNWAMSILDPKAWDSYCLGVAEGLMALALQAKNDRAAEMQLVMSDGGKFADEWLEAQGYKLRQLEPVDAQEQDWSAYSHGVVDSKKIDVRGKRLE